MLPRRRILQSALAGLALRSSSRLASAQAPFGEAHLPRLVALAAAVLPQEIGAEGQRRAVDQFLRWTRDYKAGAERDHGVLLLLALRARHNDDRAIAEGIADDGQANTRIARSAFDDQAARLQPCF